jgi:exopolysaccharide biosynthesis WecB/TagA/CpsF family protein
METVREQFRNLWHVSCNAVTCRAVRVAHVGKAHRNRVKFVIRFSLTNWRTFTEESSRMPQLMPRSPESAHRAPRDSNDRPPHLLFDRRKQIRQPSTPPVVVRLNDYDLTGFADVAADFGSESFAYVVTPNVDHLIRFCDDLSFRELYASAGFILNDSRFLSRVVSVSRGVQLRVCAGSDLTETLLSKIANANDRIVLVGPSAVQAKQLAHRYGLSSLKHFEPPMGFIKDDEAVEACLQFIEAQSPFRFCFLALGCPQQEIVANKLRERGIARGLTLCIGASINFLTGIERRAPQWMQRAGVEWAFRLLQDPGRLAKRYLIRGPRIFRLLKRIQFDLLSPVISQSRELQDLPTI